INGQTRWSYYRSRSSDGNYFRAARTAVASRSSGIAESLGSGHELVRLQGRGEVFCCSGTHGPKNQCAVGRAADDQHTARWGCFADLADQFNAFVRVIVERYDPDVGFGLPHDDGEELVPRTLRFEPNDIHSQQQRFEFLACAVV